MSCQEPQREGGGRWEEAGEPCSPSPGSADWRDCGLGHRGSLRPEPVLAWEGSQ